MGGNARKLTVHLGGHLSRDLNALTAVGRARLFLRVRGARLARLFGAMFTVAAIVSAW